MNRVQQLRTLMGPDFGAAIIANDFNRCYITHLNTPEAGTLVLTPDKAVLIIDFRYIEVARAGSRDVEVVLQDKLNEQIFDVLKEAGVTKVHLEKETTLETLGTYRKAFSGITLVEDSPLSENIRIMRSVKEEDEIDCIKRAQAITDAAFDHICGFIKPGITERQIAAELEYYLRCNGADGLAFSTIAITGSKTSMPHGVPGDKVVQVGDFITMDYGALKDNYCSDMTRTVAVGKISDEQKKVYDTVLKAHLACFEKAHAGMTGRELDSVARDIIYDAGYTGCFGHSLGHSLGLEIHEVPGANQRNEQPLGEGVIMTIEPGIYLDGKFGVRIENMALLHKDGAENLTNSPRELIVL